MQYHDHDDDWRRLLIGFLGAALAGGIADGRHHRHSLSDE
jgi:hypothetical protein